MKLLVVLVLVAVSVARPDENQYDPKYDNFNVDELIANDRLLKSYAHCFIGDGKCTPEGNDIKKWIPEGTKTSCAKCTKTQLSLVAKFIKALQLKFPTEYEIIRNQIDPEHLYDENVKEFVQKNAP